VSTVLIIGAGDLGERLTASLAARGNVRRVVLAGRSASTVTAIAATVASATDCLVDPAIVDASRQGEVAELLAHVRPDLVVQCASVRSPWALAGRADAVSRRVVEAGFALRLPFQLPIVLAVMRAARDADYAGPIANLSYPDVTGPVLRGLELAPTVGLGNAGMIVRRVRAALRATAPEAELPLVRVLGHHAQLPGSIGAEAPSAADDRVRVYVGEEGSRDDALAYRGPALASGMRLNTITTAAAMPVLEALLPGGASLRWSTPAPAGLPGGYPVRIADGVVSLDLPPRLSEAEAVAYNERVGRGDGIERIDDDGTVHFTDACKAAVADLEPELAAPLAIGDLPGRAALLDSILG
jgi:hypothetical protein